MDVLDEFVADSDLAVKDYALYDHFAYSRGPDKPLSRLATNESECSSGDQQRQTYRADVMQ